MNIYKKYVQVERSLFVKMYNFDIINLTTSHSLSISGEEENCRI